MQTWASICFDDFCSNRPASFKYRNISNIFFSSTEYNCYDSFYWYWFSSKAAENTQNWKHYHCGYTGLCGVCPSFTFEGFFFYTICMRIPAYTLILFNITDKILQTCRVLQGVSWFLASCICGLCSFSIWT